MTFRFEVVRITKRYPLQISRGTSTGSLNGFVFVGDGRHEGLGECAPGTGFDETLAALAERQLSELFAAGGASAGPWAGSARASEMGVDPSAAAAFDTALWDLLAKRAGLPLHELLGLPMPTVPTSVTIGINPIEVIRERVPEILARTGAKFLKIKLGNPEGIEQDQLSFMAAKDSAAKFGAGLRVDANGGWTVTVAQQMVSWLAEQGCDYVEQPLPAGSEDQLHEVFRNRALPIFLDESVRTSRDVPGIADRCDGVNLKLMKTGGITEALRLVATARAHGLKTMIGCMGETSVAISAGASIGALFDHIDLDSHLNLAPDPAEGTRWSGGVVLPACQSGHGARLKEDPC